MPIIILFMPLISAVAAMPLAIKAEEKQKEAIKFFTKNMIHSTPIKESEEE